MKADLIVYFDDGRGFIAEHGAVGAVITVSSSKPPQS
jgi:hypothetical protein